MCDIHMPNTRCNVDAGVPTGCANLANFNGPIDKAKFYLNPNLNYIMFLYV